MTSATDNRTTEMRSLLKERGVGYKPTRFSTLQTTFTANGVEWIVTEREATGELFAEPRHGLTPEQAIAATLGSGTCELTAFADVPFMVDYEIKGYDSASSNDYATLAECSKCGAYVIVPPEYHHVLTCDGDEVYQPYRYCPNCGREVKDEPFN